MESIKNRSGYTIMKSLAARKPNGFDLILFVVFVMNIHIG